MKNEKHFSEQSLSKEGAARRRLFGQSGGLVASFAIGSVLTGQAIAATPTTSQAPQADSQTLNQFLKISRLLTGHQNLDTTLGQRLWQALNQHSASFSAQYTALSQWISEHQPTDVEALDQQLQGQPLHDVMMSIIRGWYLGVVDNSPHTQVLSYQNALMYQVPRDGMVIPTYAHNGPDYWTAEPPPVDRLLTF
ncbi:dehydrogenase [Rosenbergiella australiborealis]|uniref:Dehydrogenase n=2 Tax=Rosenbergiella australiborealis TaxID=1544696 RepID=A0ABS5T471_9GAMM|nr:dehydrogenase [Rosenbergiella australiborealis]